MEDFFLENGSFAAFRPILQKELISGRIVALRVHTWIDNFNPKMNSYNNSA